MKINSKITVIFELNQLKIYRKEKDMDMKKIITLGLFCTTGIMGIDAACYASNGQSQPENEPQGYYDSAGGYYDPYGGYYDPYGGYYDPDGGYYDPYGGYCDPYGGYYDPDGGYYDPAGGY
ncbi:MAG: hypothetical protein LBR92_04615 [Puniceicoccales bacterium]|nr:hypothetical protein [Puniceicoccales bacterium]